MRSVGGGEREPRPEGSEPTIDEIVQKVEERMIVKRQGTPEQGCLGCGIGIGVIVFAFLVWAVVYWYYNPEFHDKPHPYPAFFQPHPTPHALRAPTAQGKTHLNERP